MKTFKSAFTLPEVLLSLVIVGVVAAITIPQVYTAANNAQAGAILGRAHEQIELGFQNIIQEYSIKHADQPPITTLSEAFAELERDEIYEKIKLHVGLDDYDPTQVSSVLDSLLIPAAYANMHVPTDDNITNDAEKSFRLSKTNATVHFMQDIDITQTSPLEIVSYLIIDVNGKSKPNTYLVDQFGFDVLNNGKIRPDDQTQEIIHKGFKH